MKLGVVSATQREHLPIFCYHHHDPQSLNEYCELVTLISCKSGKLDLNDAYLVGT